MKKLDKIEIVIDPMGRGWAADDLHEWQSFEAKYKEKLDPRWLALAIGSDPTIPPQWAVEACRALYEDHVRRVSGNKKDTPYQLDDMAESYARSPKAFTIHGAATRATGEQKSRSSAAYTLAKAWDRDDRDGRLAARVVRAILRLAGRLTVAPKQRQTR